MIKQLNIEIARKNYFNFFQIKCWEIASSSIWLHLDMDRDWCQYFIFVDANHWAKIDLTMNDNDTLKVYHLLEKHLDDIY